MAVRQDICAIRGQLFPFNFMTNHQQIEFRDPADLRVHKCLRHLYQWPDDDARFHALTDDILANGVSEPIKITADGAIGDGRHRWRAAKKAQLKSIPCQIVPESEIPELACRTLIHRKHFTAGQRAFELAGIIDDAFGEARKRRALNAAKNERNSVPFVSKTPEEWAAEIGVSVRYLRQAKELRDKFKAHPEVRTFTPEGEPEQHCTLEEYFVPRIMRDENAIGLGAALAGVSFFTEAVAKGGGKPKEAKRQFELFNQLVTDEANRWEYWQKFDDKAKAEHFKEVRLKAATLSAEVCAERAEYHRRLAKEFAEAAKQAQEGK